MQINKSIFVKFHQEFEFGACIKNVSNLQLSCRSRLFKQDSNEFS